MRDQRFWTGFSSQLSVSKLILYVNRSEFADSYILIVYKKFLRKDPESTVLSDAMTLLCFVFSVGKYT
jgi:hypothetical protein